MILSEHHLNPIHTPCIPSLPPPLIFRPELGVVFGTLQDVRTYLAASDEQQFDLVVAAETLQYLGPLEDVVADTFKVLKPGGYLSFTVDRRRTGNENDEEEDKKEQEGGDAEVERKEQVGGEKGGLPQTYRDGEA